MNETWTSAVGRRSPSLALAAVPAMAFAIALQAGCADAPPDPQAPLDRPALDRAGDLPGTHRQYGTPVQVGEGRARTYIVLNKGVPLELGVALDERAANGLPDAPTDHHRIQYLLPLPAQNPTPFQLVELDWRRIGHPPAPIYMLPHFDVHFYTIGLDERNAIDPADPSFQARASNFPAPAYIPPHYFTPLPAVGEEQMGVHWVDFTSPELPPQLKPFTRTYIYGTWDGRVIFQEPMITRDYLLTHPDVLAPIPVAARYSPAGYYPAAYRVTFDEQAREYRIGMANLAWRE
ncbi:MAG TPA: hypothetical protein VKA84_02770 [Gemmatimonadaceae bacterium]|nr:hypothetical protein [Gemmatimonadaceae bacterium]